MTMKVLITIQTDCNDEQEVIDTLIDGCIDDVGSIISVSVNGNKMNIESENLLTS